MVGSVNKIVAVERTKARSQTGELKTQPPEYQKTLSDEVIVSGVGLHLGQQTTVRLCPAEADEGRYFVRTDLSGSKQIEAEVSRVMATQLSTELGAGEAQVRTVEHLLSALLALGIDNVRIELDGPELPLLDGSALGWIKAIRQRNDAANLPGESLNCLQQSALRKQRSPVHKVISVQSGDAWVTAYPGDELRFSYGIDFDLAAIGNQWHSWSPVRADFVSEVAPARTFGLAHQIDYLRSQGLIKGGSLENALVCGQDGWLNPPLRFENEPARHKLLDLLGDLSLLGDIPKAHYVAYKASHALHVELAKKLATHCPFQPSLSVVTAEQK